MELVKEDVVIAGIGGAFPKANNIEELQTRLLNNENLMETRWRQGERGVCNIIGKVATEFFDNAYFGIHRQQSTFMDPMQRLILEKTFEALIDAGVNPNEIKGKRVGVFMASAIGENDNLFLESVVSGFGVTGHSRAMMPNRVSYWLNLKGPSVAYDSNWIGGIEVIRLAYEAIKTGQCESVIVGAANLALNAEFQWLYTDMGLLSPDGTTKAFDINASGYARSDGIVVLYIQKASDARRSYGSIVNVATTFNGDREGTLLDIDVPSMVKFMEEFYAKIPVRPEEVGFVEAYGCAHKEFDRKELEALAEVYCKNRKGPLPIGTVKGNTGHSEACAALFQVAKALIAMESDTIPATLQHETPNPEIKPLVDGRMQVVTENQKWNAKYVAINSIGIDSYYGHLLLKSNPKRKDQKKDVLPKLVLASTRTEEGIKSILDTVHTRAGDAEYFQLVHDLFAQPILGHLYRGYTLVGTEEAKKEFEYHQGNKRQIWFVYSGMGSQWNGMVSDLMKLPVFAEAIHKCQKILEPKGVDLMHIITSDDPKVFDNILNSFVGIAAIQIALTDVLKAVGITPDGIIGHSVGELGCAYADECVSAEQMILCAYSRGRASLEATLINGMMAAIGVGYNQIKDKLPASIEVACHNGPDSSTLSGPKEDMEKFVKELQDQGTFAKLVNVANIAYHSRYIKPAAPLLLKYLKEVIPEPVKRSEKWVSTSNLEENWNTELSQSSSPEYHTNNLLSSVLFEEGLKHIPKDSILIEIAPHGLLQAILKRSVKSGCTNIPLTQRGSKSGLEFLLASLGKMYLAGMDLSIANIYPKLEYPVSKATPTLANLSHWNHSESWRTGLEDKLHSLFGVRDIQVTLNSEEFRECVGHQLDEEVVLPTSFYLNIVYDIIASISSGHKEIIFENLYFRKVLTIPKIGSVPLHAMVQKGSGEFEIVSNKDLIMTGKMTFPPPNEKFMNDPVPVEVGEDHVSLSGSDVYNELQHRGHKYAGLFKAIKSLAVTEEGSSAVIQWNTRWPLFLEAMIQQQLLQSGEKFQNIQVPKTIQKIVINQNLLPQEKSDIKADYDYATTQVSAEGLQLIGMKTMPLERNPRAVFFDSVESVPLTQCSPLNKIETGISLALQLMLTNFPDQYILNVMVTEVASENPLLANIKSVLAQYPMLNPNIDSAKEAKQIMAQSSYPLLVVSNDYITDDLAKIVSTSHAFLLVKTDKNLLAYKDLIVVLEFSVNDVNYSVVRKINNSEVSVINVKGDTLSVKDLKRSSVSWVSELYAAVDAAKEKQKRVYLISSVIPLEGFTNFTQELKTLPNMEPLRVLFNLDKRSSDLKSLDIQKVFKQDLVLTIIKDGVSNGCLSVPVNFKDNLLINTATNNIIKNKSISYIGINLKDVTINPEAPRKNELGYIDYSGENNGGEKTMGLACLDKNSCSLNPDPILQWDVPERWSLEDAATIPYAYTCAYYALHTKGKLKPGDTVLIHAGCSPIGLAAISIASVEGCDIYTTCSTDWQKAYLKKQFVFLKDRHILSSDNTSFEPLLMMATGGKGAEVIVNCLSGNLLQASLACIADYGRFIQIGKYDLEENNSIGMFCFLRNTSFYVVDLDNIMNQSKEIKEELRDMVKQGLEKLCVRPLKRKVVTHHDIDLILSELKKASSAGKILINVNNNLPLSKLNTEKPNQFICDAKSSYLVYGGSAEQWTDITEWLVLRGAKKIVVSSESKPQQNHVNRRLSLLQSYFGVDIIFAPNKAHTREGASELLSEVYFLGPIHAVFLLPNKHSVSRTSDIKPVQYIDNSLRTTAPKALFVNFISSAAGICQVRSDAGFNTYNIQWLKELDFADAVTGLDDVLSLKVKNIFIKKENLSDVKQESTQGLFKKLTQMIPTSDTLIEQIPLAPNSPEMVQIVTEGPREIRELAPLFIIPGLTGEQELEELGRSLLYPTFCAVLPSTSMPIQKLATELAQQIRNIWPKGPYNIVGISWGGVLTIEIARALEKENPQVSLHLYFIDGAPITLQAALKHLGEDKKEVEISLLRRVLNINDAQVLKKLQSASTWEDRVKVGLSNVEVTDSLDKTALETGLSCLRTNLQEIVNYQPTETLVTGTVHLIRPSDASKYDNCGLTAYCKQTPQVCLVNGDHITIIKNRDTAEYINKTFQLI